MSCENKLPGVVLAAGQGTRFRDSYKLLMPFRHRAIIYHSVRALLDSQCEPVVLVVGFEHEKILKALGGLRDHPKLRIVHNERWQTGLAFSVRAAIENLPQHAPGVLFLPGDMPLMTSALIDCVAQCFLQTRQLCFPVYRGQKGHPTAFPRKFLGQLCKLEGDAGGISLAHEHWGKAEKIELEIGEECTQLDLDTEADYERLKINVRWR